MGDLPVSVLKARIAFHANLSSCTAFVGKIDLHIGVLAGFKRYDGINKVLKKRSVQRAITPLR